MTTYTVRAHDDAGKTVDDKYSFPGSAFPNSGDLTEIMQKLDLSALTLESIVVAR